MRKNLSFAQLRDQIVSALTGPPLLAFLPALTLGAFWLGGEQALLLTSLGLPLGFAAAGAFGLWPADAGFARDSVTGLMQRDEFQARMAELRRATVASGQHSACFVIAIDAFRKTEERYGQAAADLIARRSGERISSVIRDGDFLAHFDLDRFAICLSPVARLDLEMCIQLAGRLQAAVEDPILLDGTTVYVSCSMGFCQSARAPGQTGRDWLDATVAALGEAQQNGPSSIRAYTASARQRSTIDADLRGEIRNALENGQIRPWFQPQVSTDTGKVTGFEALARWVHPSRGVLAPDMFLSLADDCALLEKLGQVMRHHALKALRNWDDRGLHVPRVGVNFAADELRDPRLVDRLRWELDRLDLAPGRLAVEVLETVFSSDPDDVIARNIAGLSALGCWIDLDDFGTGHASIASIKRFEVSRIKIDKSFVTRSDRDPRQQQLVGAILTMAERLELETLAEGVETAGEHVLLAQLGCGHVQGFGIGRPMPFEQTADWINSHEAKLKKTPEIGRSSG